MTAITAPELYAEHYACIRSYARRHVDNDDAEDVAQQTMIGALRAQEGFRGQGALRSWLCGIAQHKCVDVRRRRAHDWRTEDALAAECRRDADVEAQALQRAEAGEVWAALDRLPYHYRQALVLRYIEGQPVDAMAQACGVTFKTMESRLTRAREAFRAAYQGE